MNNIADEANALLLDLKHQQQTHQRDTRAKQPPASDAERLARTAEQAKFDQVQPLNISTWKHAIKHHCEKCGAAPGAHCTGAQNQIRQSHHRERYKHLANDPQHTMAMALAYSQAALRAAINSGQPETIITGLASAMDHIEAAINTAEQNHG